MKALRNKISKEWLSEISSTGQLYTGSIPKEVGEKMQSVSQIEDSENAFRGISNRIDLSAYELIEIVILEKAEYDNIQEQAWKYQELCK